MKTTASLTATVTHRTPAALITGLVTACGASLRARLERYARPATYPPPANRDLLPAASGRDGETGAKDGGRPGWIRVLGPPVVEGPTGRLVSARKGVWDLLGLLTEYRDGLPRDIAYQFLWPDTDPQTDRDRFWRPMRNLRALLCKALGLPATSGKHVIQHIGNHVYRLNPTLFSTDVWQLRDLLRLSAHAASLPARADALRRAAELYRGELLPESAYSWVESVRQDIAQRVLRALTQLAELETDPDGRADLLARAAAIDPLDETISRQRMMLHHRRGNRAAIHRIYQDLTGRLHALGPTFKTAPETRILYYRLTGESEGAVPLRSQPVSDETVLKPCITRPCVLR